MALIGAKDKRCPRRCRGLRTQVHQTLSMAGVFGGEAIMLTRREAAGRDRLLMAGRSLHLSTGNAGLTPDPSVRGFSRTRIQAP